ncbi:MAG: MoaD/ThiS family protein [Gammaproteobacteria bacterium]|nr:MoaD/ThiS family protein [Gammaproteobacteria bacterium]
MKVQVLFFASLRESMGKTVCEVDLNVGDTVSDLWNTFKKSTGQSQMLCAVNHEYSTLDHELCNGDEVAFFPPVTGG